MSEENLEERNDIRLKKIALAKFMRGLKWEDIGTRETKSIIFTVECRGIKCEECPIGQPLCMDIKYGYHISK